MQRTLLAVAATVATAVAGPALALASPQGPAPSGTTVVLPTGDRVLTATVAGRTSVRVLPAEQRGVAGSFQRVHLGADDYVIPTEARPFVGRLIDPSLFDVTELASLENGGRIPVSVRTSDPSSPQVPGLTVTSRSATTAQGWLDESGAAAIRAELVRDWESAAGPDHRYPARLFGNVTSLALAGEVPPVAPAYQQVTLVVKVLDSRGKPAPFGMVTLSNTDDARRFVQFAEVSDGEARVSVPLGHYSAITDVADFDPSTGDFVDRILPVADYTVRSNLQRLTFHAADATVRPSVSTPRPGVVQQQSVEFDRVDRRGGVVSNGYGYQGGGFQVLVAPTPQVQVGGLFWLTAWNLTGGSAQSGGPYSYDLSWAASGSVPSSQQHTVSPASLAIVQARYYNDQPRHSQFVRVPVYPFQTWISASFDPLNTPVQRTEYVNGDSGAGWYASLIADPSRRDWFGGLIDDDLRRYAAGTTQRVSWQRGMLAPGVPQPTRADHYVFCPACRTATELTIGLAPFTDATPGHVGEVFGDGRAPATSFALYRDGTKIAGGEDSSGARVPVPAGEATYRVHLRTDRGADRVLTAPRTTTDLTFRSSAQDGFPLPRYWHCGFRPAVDDPGCTVLPVLTARLPLPTDLTDRMRIGTSTAELTIAPLGGGTNQPITRASVAIDTGSGLRPAAVHRLANGRYRVTFSNPADAAGSAVTVRVAAADARGDRLLQTTEAAYLVADR